MLELALRVLLIAVAAGYAAATVAFWRRRDGLGAGLSVAAWLLNLAAWGVHGVATGQPPFGNMHQVMTFVALCFLPSFLVLWRRERLGWLIPYFTLVSVIPIIGACCMDPDLDWRRVPALQSPWFIPHVAAYMLSYSLAGVACLLSVVSVVQARSPDNPVRSERASRYSDAAYRVMRFGFPFMTFGMLSGALWAEEAWGVYWSWDPKETWSLVTWTTYLIYFHCRRHPRWRRYADRVQIAAFAALLITFLAVNLLPKLSSALHSYA